MGYAKHLIPEKNMGILPKKKKIKGKKKKKKELRVDWLTLKGKNDKRVKKGESKEIIHYDNFLLVLFSSFIFRISIEKRKGGVEERWV